MASSNGRAAAPAERVYSYQVRGFDWDKGQIRPESIATAQLIAYSPEEALEEAIALVADGVEREVWHIVSVVEIAPVEARAWRTHLRSSLSPRQRAEEPVVA